MLLSKCDVCDGKKSEFIKEQEANGLLRSFRIKTPSNKIPFQVLFCFREINKLIQDMKLIKQVTCFYQQEINLCLKCI